MNRPSIVRHLFDAFAFHVPGAPNLSHLGADGLYNSEVPTGENKTAGRQFDWH